MIVVVIYSPIYFHVPCFLSLQGRTVEGWFVLLPYSMKILGLLTDFTSFLSQSKTCGIKVGFHFDPWCGGTVPLGVSLPPFICSPFSHLTLNLSPLCHQTLVHVHELLSFTSSFLHTLSFSPHLNRSDSICFFFLLHLLMSPPRHTVPPSLSVVQPWESHCPPSTHASFPLWPLSCLIHPSCVTLHSLPPCLHPSWDNYYKPCKDQLVFKQLNKQGPGAADSHCSTTVQWNWEHKLIVCMQN